MKNKIRSITLDTVYWISILTFLFYGCGSFRSNENYQVKGKLKNANGETVSLVDVNSNEMKVIDSVKVDENGEFIFTKKVPEKGFYSIQTSSSNFATIIADSTEKISFEGDAKNLSDDYKITGSADGEALVHFNELTKRNFKELQKIRYAQDSIRRAYEAYMNTSSDSLELDSLSKAIEPAFNALSANYQKILNTTNSFIRKFINENASSFAALGAVQMLSPDKEISYYEKVANALIEKYPNVKNLKNFKEYVDSKKKLALGSPAPEITMNDKNGKPLSLSSLKGKVVVVDFWASWCKPCRAENPFMVELYSKYKSKGLEIFSVSLDFNKDAWLKAIEHDKLSWKDHVTDLKQWQSPVVTLYGFDGIPFTCILDKNGNIVGKNFRGSELEEKIKELL